MKTLVLFLLVPVILALPQNYLEFGANYFKYRNVKFVCLLTCEEKISWVHQFAKRLLKHSIGISQVSLVDFNPNKIETCVSHHLVDIGILVDAKCPMFDDVLYYASENMLFDSTRKWLIMDGSTNVTNFNNSTILPESVQVFNKLNMSVNADLVLATETENGYRIYEMYNYGKIQGGELTVNDMGIWNADKGTELNNYKYYKRWNFQQWPMRMIVVTTASAKVFEPSWLTDRRPTPGLAPITKTSSMVLNEVAQIHNFRFVFTIVDRWIGDFNKNDSHKVVATSIYYRLQDVSPVLRYNKQVFGKIDVVHPPLTSIELHCRSTILSVLPEPYISHIQSEDLAYILHAGQTGWRDLTDVYKLCLACVSTRYYYRIPTYGAGKFENQFLRPLSPGAWWSVVFVSTLCGCLLLTSAMLEQRPLAGQYAFFSVLASISQQFFEDNDNGTRNPSAARKLTILVTGVSCLLIYNYYTSSVVSWLLSGLPPSINSLEELFDSPLELLIEDTGYARSWLQNPRYYFNKRNSKIEDLLRQKKVKDKNSVLASLDHGIGMVKAGGYAFHTEVESANRLISQSFTQAELCELGSLQSMERTMLYGCVQKNSPYKEFLNWSLMRLMERGIVSCVQQRTRSFQVKCEGSSPRALALGGAAPAFLLLAGGYVLAIAIMLLERLAEKQKLLMLRKILQ